MWAVFAVGTRYPLATRWGRRTLDWRLWFPKEIVKIVQLRKAETDRRSLISSPQYWKSKLIFTCRFKYHCDTNLHPNCFLLKTVAQGMPHSSPIYTLLRVLHVSTIHFFARHLKPFKFVSKYRIACASNTPSKPTLHPSCCCLSTPGTLLRCVFVRVSPIWLAFSSLNYCPESSNIDIIWEIVRNIDARAPSQISWIRKTGGWTLAACVLTSPLQWFWCLRTASLECILLSLSLSKYWIELKGQDLLESQERFFAISLSSGHRMLLGP